MPLATRHRTDPAPHLARMTNLVVRRESRPHFMATLQGRTEEEMTRRFASGHRAYVAWVGDAAAAWGWVATQTAEIGELGAAFGVPPGERYLWNFVTLRAHRGQGIYPRLLDAIVRVESREATRFWIAYAPENRASGAGIGKAGFAPVADLSFDGAGIPAVRRYDGSGGAPELSLGLAESERPLLQCWRCARTRSPAIELDCARSVCRCDYQRPELSCAA